MYAHTCDNVVHPVYQIKGREEASYSECMCVSM